MPADSLKHNVYPHSLVKLSLNVITLATNAPVKLFTCSNQCSEKTSN